MPECPNCGTDVPEGGAYCSECGQQMAGHTGDAVPPPPPPPPPPAGQTPQPAAPSSDPSAAPQAAPQQPVYASPAAAARAQGAPKSRTGLIVFLVVAVVVLLLCCCIGVVGYAAYTDSDDEPVAVPAEPAVPSEEPAGPAEEPVEETEVIPTETPYVTLTWAEDVDLDLEIWNDTGENQLSAAWDQGNEVTSAGTEEFVFEDFAPTADFSEGQFSTGTFSVAVFMSDAKGITEDVGFTVVAYDAYGGDTEFASFVNVAEPDNFWEGFQIDAETGAILEVYDVHSGDELTEAE